MGKKVKKTSKTLVVKNNNFHKFNSFIEIKKNTTLPAAIFYFIFCTASQHFKNLLPSLS